MAIPIMIKYYKFSNYALISSRMQISTTLQQLHFYSDTVNDKQASGYFRGHFYVTLLIWSEDSSFYAFENRGRGFV